MPHTLLCLGFAMLAAACTPKVDKGGYIRNDKKPLEIKAGQTSRQDVAEAMGSPSSQSSFGTETWYYISNRKESLAFLPYEVAEQEVMRIEFDDSGLVSKVENYDLAQSEPVHIVQRETPSEGHSLGFFEQILGNIGRFNSPGGRGQPSNNRGGGGVGR